MKLDLGSFAFGSSVSTGGNTPSWGTSLGQKKPELKFTYPGYDNIIIGMLYKSIPLHKVYIPLGKGGHVCNSLEDEGIQLAALFDKVYINEVKIDAPFIMLIYQDGSDSWAGRRTLKYNIKIEYRIDNNSIIYNSDFITAARNALHLEENACWVISDIYVVNQDELHFIAGIVNPNNSEEYPSPELRKTAFLDAIKTAYDEHSNFLKKLSSDNINIVNEDGLLVPSSNLPCQIIYYGAPGTGKSHIVKQKTQGESVVRTTFHPDSDYSTFVGAYKPTTEKVAIRDVTGKVIIENGLPVKENRIEYKFVEQAFLKAYIKAWKFYAEIEENAEPKKQYLIIEEINRGNCAQIFGDLFQLLDRNDYGFSDYYIHADKDIQKHLSEALNNLVIEESYKKKINSMYHEDVVEKVLSGEILLLPNNFYIWATMNTSDQSLFPIDSAFKRRWNWKYRPIVKGRDEEGNELNWKIVANKEYDWWSFLEKINAVVASTTNSEDKKLGFFFCKAVDGVISAETFVDKVIFYLWNDVFKNFGFEDSIFNDEEDKSKLEFDKFYTTNTNGETIIRVDKVEKFLDNLKVEVIGEAIVDEEVNVNTTITVNDKKVKYINAIPYTAIEEYVNLNPNKSAQEIVAIWENFKKYSTRSWIICDKEGYNKIDPRYANYSYKIVCGDGEFVWVNKDGWMYHPKNQLLRDSISEFIKAVNEANLGISIKETIL